MTELPTDRSRAREVAIALAGGFLVSLAAGLFGVGGGVLLVPLLVLALRRPQHVAHATSLVAVLFASVSGGLRFALDDAVAWEGAGILAVAAVIGAQVGAKVLPKLTDTWLRNLFGGVLLLISLRFITAGSGAAVSGLHVPDLDLPLVLAHVAAGLGIGVSSAVLGVGGGVLLVPVLVLAFGYGQHVAEGTSLAVIVPTALSGAVAHHRNGYTDWGLGGLLGVTGLVGGAAGASFALGLDPDLLGRLFGVLLAAVCLVMLVPPGRIRRP